jgi:hypothetical protein
MVCLIRALVPQLAQAGAWERGGDVDLHRPRPANHADSVWSSPGSTNTCEVWTLVSTERSHRGEDLPQEVNKKAVQLYRLDDETTYAQVGRDLGNDEPIQGSLRPVPVTDGNPEGTVPGPGVPCRVALVCATAKSLD